MYIFACVLFLYFTAEIPGCHTERLSVERARERDMACRSTPTRNLGIEEVQIQKAQRPPTDENVSL
jgi:hypothetical protein